MSGRPIPNPAAFVDVFSKDESIEPGRRLPKNLFSSVEIVDVRNPFKFSATTGFVAPDMCWAPMGQRAAAALREAYERAHHSAFPN